MLVIGKEEARRLALKVLALGGTKIERSLAGHILRESISRETMIPEEGEDAVSVRPAARVLQAAPAPTPLATVRAACNLSGPSGRF